MENRLKRRRNDGMPLGTTSPVVTSKLRSSFVSQTWWGRVTGEGLIPGLNSGWKTLSGNKTVPDFSSLSPKCQGYPRMSAEWNHWFLPQRANNHAEYFTFETLIINLQQLTKQILRMSFIWRYHCAECLKVPTSLFNSSGSQMLKPHILLNY